MTNYLKTAGQDTDRQWFGVYMGVVTTSTGTKLKAQVPQVLGTETTNWAFPLGTVTSAPVSGSTVAIMFMGGDINAPYYLVLG